MSARFRRALLVLATVFLTIPPTLGAQMTTLRGRVIDVTESAYTIELTGNGEKLDAFIDALRGAGIVEVVRSGVLAIARGDKGLRMDEKQGQAPVARAASAG